MSSKATPSGATAAIRSAQPLKLPVGVNDFAELVGGGFTFVDKTVFIPEFLGQGSKVTLITRPRRFGKTLNLSMLQYFFAAQVIGRDTHNLFDGLSVGADAAAMAHQGKYPVIFLTFKDIKADSYEECLQRLRTLLANLYLQYPELLTSPRVEADRLEVIRAIRTRQADTSQLEDSLRFLSQVLYEHYSQPVVILLDEYDSPLQNAYLSGYYAKLVSFMRNLLSAALKDNTYLWKALVTGITRISKESIFSGLNNLDVWTVLDEKYRSCFGFTEAEVAALLQVAGLADTKPSLGAEIKSWYDGYHFGGEVIYNPWSIIGCLNRQGELAPYWVNSGGNDLLKRLIWKSSTAFKEDMERLMRGEPVQQSIDPNLVFDELDGNTTALWSLLLFSGYLTARDIVRGLSKQVHCTLSIPNLEIGIDYRDIIKKWLMERLGGESYRNIVQSLVRGDIDMFSKRLRDFLLGSMSFFDSRGRDPESVYHALLLGLMATVDETHVITSNRESGYGRYDIALTPRLAGGLGIVFELKATRDSTRLKQVAQTAFAQIRAQRYDAQMLEQAGNVVGIGLGFCGKRIAVVHGALGDDAEPDSGVGRKPLRRQARKPRRRSRPTR